ncbi:hypothetical protein NCCP2716_01320 [Sporosarcina sp. NCCP-2716]|uniref:aspartyl-phosphate phosphatase Spo0E family protein n=1 Tax=Sporosarcina sp. NCCP-2716 TaxID=2943679 RepID=UPI00203FFFD9|nr:aspartyl-phosphate phosphatase Spo0E family protein [Sporosarcina sp. NCCP-2716]GKV67634.1 hypothetical protein NCCP2716_01320 [Sporosarcina sp. NCCP-2716]
MNKLERKIEQTRKELLTTAREKGLSSADTIRLSVELDHLLNAYDMEKEVTHTILRLHG